MNKFLVCAFTLPLLVSCSGVRSSAVVPVQSKDKQLSCKEMMLEMNEAEEYKKAAENNKNPDVRSFIAPLGYMYTITSANEAIDASEKRITYLKDIYRISGCEAGSSVGLTNDQMRGHTFSSGYPVPAPYMQQPAPQQQYYAPQPQQQPYGQPAQQQYYAPQPQPAR